jgi:serpin B
LRCYLPPFALALAATALLACSSPSPSDDADIAQSAHERDASPKVATDDRMKLRADNVAFALDLTRRLTSAKPDANVFVSPYSISVATAMLYAGARGETATEMALAMRFSLPQVRLHPAFDAVDLELHSRNAPPTGGSDTGARGLQLNIASSLWAEKSARFEAPFLDTLATSYGAGMRLADFIHAPDPSRLRINAWTADATHGRIKELLQAKAVDGNTRLVVVNAIYFNATWASPFDPTATASGPFTRADSSLVSADFMSALGHYSYGEGDAYQAVDLPYSGAIPEDAGKTSMLVVLPREGATLPFELGLDAAMYQQVAGSLHDRRVDLKLPKFEIAGDSLSLRGPLEAMGMTRAFDERSADFSGMSASPLYVQDIVHKAFVKVDEKGTEAAAATAGVVGVPIMATDEPPPTTLTIDRPFYVFIRDVPTGTVLFAGRIADPSSR